MNELDFIDALSDRDSKRATAAREFLGKLKTSGVVDSIKQFGKVTKDFAQRNAPQIGAGLAGAGVVSGATYLRSLSKGGKPSSDQQMTSALLASSEARKDQAERDHRPISFREDMTDAIYPSAKNIADVFARHPVRGALMVAPAGALAGLAILKALK
jgi:hypothetical protein